MAKAALLFNRPRILFPAGVMLLVVAILICYLPNPLIGGSILATVLLLLFFWARPWSGLLFFLFVRASLDISKDYFSVYLSDSFQITGANALSFLLIIGGVIYILANRVSFKRIPLAWFFLIFLALSMIHFLLVDNIQLSLMEFLRFFSAYLIYLLVWDLCRSEKDLRVLINTIILSSLIPIAAGLFQVLLNRGQFITGFIRAYGTFAHPNPYAFYLLIILALAMNLFLYQRRKNVRLGLSLLIVTGAICILVSFSRAAWFSLLLIIFFLAFFRQRKLFWVFIIVVLAFGFLSPIRSRFYDLSTSFNSLAYRLSIWEGGMSHLSRYPVIGQGLGSFKSIDVLGELAHNDYLRVFFELGLLGLLIYLSLSAVLLVRLGQLVKSRLSNYTYSVAVAAFSVAVVFIAASVINNLLFRPVLQWYFWALMAAALRGGRMEEIPP